MLASVLPVEELKKVRSLPAEGKECVGVCICHCMCVCERESVLASKWHFRREREIVENPITQETENRFGRRGLGGGKDEKQTNEMIYSHSTPSVPASSYFDSILLMLFPLGKWKLLFFKMLTLILGADPPSYRPSLPRHVYSVLSDAGLW